MWKFSIFWLCVVPAALNILQRDPSVRKERLKRPNFEKILRHIFSTDCFMNLSQCNAGFVNRLLLKYGGGLYSTWRQNHCSSVHIRRAKHADSWERKMFKKQLFKLVTFPLVVRDDHENLLNKSAPLHLIFCIKILT